jgi:hypothetical protein
MGGRACARVDSVPVTLLSPAIARWRQIVAKVERNRTQPPAGAKSGQVITPTKEEYGSPAPSRVGVVYFVEAPRSGAVKVGFTRDLSKRLPALQTGSPEKLQVLAWYPTRREAETALHAALAGYRLHGEWFESEPVKIALEDGSLASICSDLKGSDCD